MKFKVKAVPPFDFDLSAKIFSEGDPQIRRYEKGRYWQTIRADGRLFLMTLEASGSDRNPAVSVSVEPNEGVTAAERSKIGKLASSLFNVNLDVRSFYETVKKDPVMFELTCKLRGLRSPSTVTVFEALVDSLIEQQIALSVAHVFETRIIKTFGDRLKTGGQVYFAYPTPRKLASATVDSLRKIGLSQRKAEYIKDISRLIASGRLDLEKFKEYEDSDRVIKELDEIRGVGVWTAELTMVRGMGKLDALPADDLGLRRIIARYYCRNRKISGEEARKIALRWGKWRGLASFYLIVADMLDVRA